MNKRECFEAPLGRSFEEKDSCANLCVRKHNIEIPVLVDSTDYPVEEHHTAWPDRLRLADREDKDARKRRPGPGGFKPAELKAAITHKRGAS